jgi:hypothetical protein
MSHNPGFGAITDAALQSAAVALLSDLQSSGCVNGYDQAVADFQSAWNTANAGSPLVLSNGTPGADGLYGANTQAALQATLNAVGISQQAPTGCVAAMPGSANQTQGGGSAVVPPAPAPPPAPLPPSPVVSNTTTTTGGSNWILWVVGAAAVAGVGAAIMVHRKKRGK